MRIAATLSLLALLSAPMLAEEKLAPDDVGRFIDAAREVVSVQPIPPGVPPARHLTDVPVAERVAERHGFTDRRWRQLAERVLTAHHVERLVDQPAPERRRAGQPQPTNVSSGDLRQRALVASTTREDINALVAQTAADREVIRPFRDKLDALVDSR